MKNPPTGFLKNPKLKVSQSARRKGRGLCLWTHWDVFKFDKRRFPEWKLDFCYKVGKSTV